MMNEKTVRNMQIATAKWNKIEKLMHLVGFTVEIYHDARTYKRHINNIYIVVFDGI